MGGDAIRLDKSSLSQSTRGMAGEGCGRHKASCLLSVPGKVYGRVRAEGVERLTEEEM